MVGNGTLHEALEKKIEWNKAVDGNGTEALKYMEEMGGLELSGILGGIE